jgi:hypothetical protein
MRFRILACLALVGAGDCGSAVAQSSHDQWHAVYETWTRPDGRGSCCNRFDCKAVVYRDNGHGIEIRIDELGGTWHQVPLKTVLPFPSFNADAHACYVLQWCRTDGKHAPCRPDIRCVALPMSM